ncbi:3-hydroxyacyl-CoA dehydrogenase family protein [Faecalibacillus intestinalis]|uniref:3-hydroxyacyl-CoA dehydrogenase family protein n=1 Tax=Faecalibacillus intestinalis TaxID=1982626 RepID=UPI00352309AB
MNIKTVTVLGANGTMGRNVAAIFASFGHAKVYMVCRNRDKANKAIVQAYKSIRAESIKEKLVPATYDELDQIIPQSDLIFESLTEDFKIKEEMYSKIKSYLKEDVIISTGTSGLSIKKLAESFGDKRKRFFGIHMFNPPYSLTLCELIVHDESQHVLASKLKEYLSNQLDRTVVEVKDKPSFLGNRIGFFFINEALLLAEQYKNEGGIDYIDSILGAFTGRTMAPLTTADFVGLDVTKSILDYICQEVDDEFNDSFKSTNFLNELVLKGDLGRKTNKGLFYKDKDRNLTFVYDVKQGNYRLKNNYNFYFSNEMINCIKVGDYEKAISLLVDDESQEAILCKKMLLKYIIYSLKISNEVSNNIESCDDAMATGFSWLPPIAMIDLFGGLNHVQDLSKKYLDERYINIIMDKEITDKLPEHSKYDYRSYLKARY